MTFDEYQKAAMVTAHYPHVISDEVMSSGNLVYPALKLAGEAGEYADKVGKIWRNTGTFPNRNTIDVSTKIQMIRELGDVLWYIAASAKELGCDLDTVAKINIEKLKDRFERGVICGEGDNR